MNLRSKSRDAAHLALGLQNLGTVFDKLRWELRQMDESWKVLYALEDDSHDERATVWMAINAAGTAWSVVEWAYRDLEAEGREGDFLEYVGLSRGSQLSELKRQVQLQCAPMRYCHQISHAAKHAKLERMHDGLSAPIVFHVVRGREQTTIQVLGMVEEKHPGVRLQSTVQLVLRDALLWGLAMARELGLKTTT